MNPIIKDLLRKQRLATRRFQLAQKWLEEGRGNKTGLKLRCRNALEQIYHLGRAVEALRRL